MMTCYPINMDKETQTFKNIMKKRGVSQIQMSNDTGIDQGMISKIMSGKRGYSVKTLIKIADYLEITTDKLLNR